MGVAPCVLTSFSTTPLRIARVLGLLTALASVAVSLTLLPAKFLFGPSVDRWATIVTPMTFLARPQVVLRIIGEYMEKTYLDVQRRPLHIISEAL